MRLGKNAYLPLPIYCVWKYSNCNQWLTFVVARLLTKARLRNNWVNEILVSKMLSIPSAVQRDGWELPHRLLHMLSQYNCPRACTSRGNRIDVWQIQVLVNSSRWLYFAVRVATTRGRVYQSRALFGFCQSHNITIEVRELWISCFV